MTASEASFALVPCIVGVSTVAPVLYTGVRSVDVAPGVSGRNIALVMLIWINGPWFLVEVSWSHSVWVVVMDVGMLGLFIVVSEPVLLRMGSWGEISRWPHLFGGLDLGFLGRWLVGMVCVWCWWT